MVPFIEPDIQTNYCFSSNNAPFWSSAGDAAELAWRLEPQLSNGAHFNAGQSGFGTNETWTGAVAWLSPGELVGTYTILATPVGRTNVLDTSRFTVRSRQVLPHTLTLPTGKHRSVDFHGVPIPDADPTGESEMDRPGGRAHIDAYTRQPQYTADDVAIPVEGGQLALEFRRTLGVRSYPVDDINGYLGYRSDTCLGPAWDSSLGARIVLAPDTTRGVLRATVRDEVGGSYDYIWTWGAGSAGWQPDAAWTFNNEALKARLANGGVVTQDQWPNAMTLTRHGGSELTFEPALSDASGSYMRLAQVKDSNGNTLVYSYPNAASLLPSSLREVRDGAHDRALTFDYTNIVDNFGRWTTRLASVTDPLGRETRYEYFKGGDPLQYHGFLKRVVPPSVPDSDGNAVNPAVAFAYTVSRFYDSIEDTSLDVVAPASITDARGQATTFTYAPAALPSRFVNGLVAGEWSLALTAVGTADGVATLADNQRSVAVGTGGHVVETTITDTRGVATHYGFYGDVPVTSYTNTLPLAAYITNVTRRTSMGSSPELVATFEYAADYCGNLVKVRDVNGTLIRYDYASGAAGDAYDATVTFWNGLAANHYALFGLPARRVYDAASGGLALTTEYRYDAAFNKLIEKTDPLGVVTRYALDAAGNRTSATEAAGTAVERVSGYQYDSHGFMTRARDPDSRVTRYEPDDYGNLQQRIVDGYEGGSALGLTTAFVRDIVGRPLVVTDPNGNVSSNAFDNADRLLTEWLPPVEGAQGAIRHAYDLNGNETKRTVENGTNTQVIVQTYDAMNRLTSKRLRLANPNANDGADIVTAAAYDELGQLASATDANGNTTTYTYDNAGRMTRKDLPSVTEPDGAHAYHEEYAYGKNSGSGAFGLGGWKPVRVANARGYVVDTAFDTALRATQTVQRISAPSDPAAAPASGEPAVLTAYNAAGVKIAETALTEDFSGNPANRVTYFYYDHLYRLTAGAVDMTGDGVGVAAGAWVDEPVNAAFNASCLVTRKTYDQAGNDLAIIDAEGHTSTKTWDGAGRVVQQAGNPVLVFEPVTQTEQTLTPTIAFDYDANGNVTLATDPAGTQTKSFFDARNRLVKTILDLDKDGNFEENGHDVVVRKTYDIAGNVMSVTDPNGAVTDTAYDRAFRVVQVTAPQVYDAESAQAVRPTAQTTYDKNSNVRTITDPRGIVTETTYDQWNRPRTVTAAKSTADEVVTEKEYDSDGNVTALILHNVVNSAAHDQRTTYTFDAFDRVLTETLPDIGDSQTRTKTTAYYRDGTARIAQDAKGQTSEFDYDRAGRLTQTRFKESGGAVAETRNFTYNKVGKPLTVSDLNGSTAYGYDELYRQTDETRQTTGQAAYSVQSRYDLLGNRTKCAYSDGRTLISQYDPRNLVLQVSDSNAVSAYAYDLNGNQLSLSTPNGVVTTNAFDALNRVLNRTAVNGATNIYAVSYQYDLVGNRRTILEDIAQQGIRNSTYGYDSQYRLTYETNVLGGVTNSAVYSFDLAGNRLTLIHTVTGQVAQIDYSYNDLNELLSASNQGTNTSYSYDLNGSRLSKISGVTTQQFCYDTINRLVAVTNLVGTNAGVAIFSASYDYRTRRLTKTENGTTTYFRYDGGESFQEYITGSLTVEYVRGSGLGGGIGSILYSDRTASGGDKEFFTYNAVGHTVALTSTNGAVQKTDLYEAYGNIVSSTGSSLNNRLANTKERDASIALDDHGMRYFDPEIGLYISRDPAGYGDGMNVYLYVHCNPINHIDPLGLEVKPDDPKDAAVVVDNLQKLTTNKLKYDAKADKIVIEKQAPKNSTTPKGDELIERVIASEKKMVIEVTKSGGNSEKDVNPEKAKRGLIFQGAGSDTTIKFNPKADPKITTVVNEKTGDTSEKSRPPQIGLGHEVIHGDRSMRGAAIDYSKEADWEYKASGQKKKETVPAEELATVGLKGNKSADITENDLRTEQKQDKRGAY